MSGAVVNPADLSTAFISLLLEGMPFIFIGTLISGFIDAYLPQGMMERLLPKRRSTAIFVSGLLGFLFPVCECAIVPVIRRLIQKGLPVSCAITYMLSAPIINPITVLSTLSAFSEEDSLFHRSDPVFVTCSRLLIAYIVTVFIGFIVQYLAPEKLLKARLWKAMAAREGADAGHHHGGPRVVTALRTAMRDCVDTGMYFIIGVAITSFFNTTGAQTLLGAFSQNVFAGVAGMMGLSFILSLCSTSDAFIAATLQVRFPTPSVSYASKLAFLVFGPMMDVKLLFMYSSIFRAKFVWALVVGLFLLVGAICSAWSLIPLP